MSGTRDPLYDAPVWTLYHRPRGGGRWVAVASGLTFSAAVARSDGPGDWWYSFAKAEPARRASARKPAAAAAESSQRRLFAP
ncbi:MAG TPA: hypothetical protein VD866_24160 [Urbifossiella sp.]|nr:hypothetical protein [Urbifossiella sp.]